MSDSGDPKQDKQREIDAEREFYETDTEGTQDPKARATQSNSKSNELREKVLSITGMCSGPYDSPHRCSALHCDHCGFCDESETLTTLLQQTALEARIDELKSLPMQFHGYVQGGTQSCAKSPTIRRRIKALKAKQERGE